MIELPIRRPGRTLLAAAVVVLAAAPGLLRLELRTDGRALVPDAAPEVVYDRQVREAFGIRDPIAIVLRTNQDGGIFRTATLQRVAQLSVALQELEGVRSFDVVSLASELGFRHRPGTLLLRPLLEPVPQNAEQVAELREDLRRIELYDGTLVSRDSSATAILVATPPERDRRELIREIRTLVAAGFEVDGEKIDILGSPVAESLLGSHILADLGVPPSWLGDAMRPGHMVPIAVGVMALVFFAAFRRPAAVLLPLSEIGICLLVVFGVMGWLGIPIYLTISVLPIILTAIGAADEIHIFRRYVDLRPAEITPEGHRELVRTTLREMAPPVVATSVTTAVAFLSFALSPIPAVRVFGLLTAFGVLLCMLYSLSVIPALLVLGGPELWVGRHRSRPLLRVDAWATALAALACRRRATVLGVAGLVVLLTIDGVRRIEVQDSWIDGFAASSAFARATRWFDEQFLGSHLLQVSLEIDAPTLEGEVDESALSAFELTLDAPVEIDPARLVDARIRVFAQGENSREWRTYCESARREGTTLVLTMPRLRGSAKFFLRPEPGHRLGYEIRSEPLTSPAVLRRIGELEDFAAQLDGVGGVLGPARYLETVAFMVRPDDEGSRRLPEDPQAARNHWSNYARMRGEDRLAQLVDAERRRALMTLYLRDSNYVDTRHLMAQIRDYGEQHLLPHGMHLGFAGDVAVSQATIGAIVTTQLRSLLLSLAGILAVAAILSRSLLRGAFCVIPPAFAVLVSFAAMGWLAIPLGVATSMFAGMTLGIGVDFAIHLQARYSRERKLGRDMQETLAAAIGTTGPAILIDACAVALGFGVLVFSQVPANARLGGLLMASVFGCLISTLVVIPALLAHDSIDIGVSEKSRARS